MKKTIEATWHEGFVAPDALIAPKVNDLYGRKSTHIVDKVQRMFRINEAAIVVGAPIMWLLLRLAGIPYTGAILWVALMALVVYGRLYIAGFEAPGLNLDSYQYLKAFHAWLTDRMARTRSVQRHIYAVMFLALAIGIGASSAGHAVIDAVIERSPDATLVLGIPLVLVVALAAMTLVVEVLGGLLFDLDVSTVYRGVFNKLDEMLKDMEALAGPSPDR
jgi:hypothetical protein